MSYTALRDDLKTTKGIRLMEDRMREGVTSATDSEESVLACNLTGDRRKSWGLVGYPLAMVYSPVQEFHNMYEIETALRQGTVFKELDLPFMGMTVTKGGGCRD